VILRPGGEASGEELRAWYRERIAHDKVPRYWTVIDSFPMTVSGKIQQFRLRVSSHRR
jgi:fatty-acyl-CoA synthase